MKDKDGFKVRGLSDAAKDFLYNYAQKNLYSKSRNKAILHLINEKMIEQNLPNLAKKEGVKPAQKLQGGGKKKRIQLSLRKSDFDVLDSICEATNCSIQYYIISLILDDLYGKKRLNGTQIEELRKSNYQLYKIGVNVNQIAKSINEGNDRKLATEKLADHISSHINVVKKLLANSLEKY